MIPHPTDPRHAWSRLTRAAGTVQDPRPTGAPYGFASRVAALAMSEERRSVSLVDLFALRALGVACLLAVLSVAVNYGELARRLSGGGATEDLLVSDPVSVVLALSD